MPQVDVLVTDVIMPGMSGRELFDHMRADRPQLPVVFMSGYTDQVIAPHGVLEAGTHFVQKPFAAETLGSAVRHALDSHAHRPMHGTALGTHRRA